MNLKLIVLLLMPLSLLAQPLAQPPAKPKWNAKAVPLDSQFVYTCPKCDTLQTNKGVVSVSTNGVVHKVVKLTCAKCKLSFMADVSTNAPPAPKPAKTNAPAKKDKRIGIAKAAPQVEDAALPPELLPPGLTNFPPVPPPDLPMPPLPTNLPPVPPVPPAPVPQSKAAAPAPLTLPQAVSVSTLVRMIQHQGDQNYVYDTDYLVVCQKCYERQTLKPTKITERTNTVRQVKNGYEVDRILDFKCPLCKTKFVCFDTAFAPTVTATKAK